MELAGLRQLQQLPRSVRLGLATTFAMMGVSGAEMAIALVFLNSWRLGIIGMVVFSAAIFVGGAVIVRDWPNLGWRYRVIGAGWTICGAVPIFLILRWVADKWGHIAGHAA